MTEYTLTEEDISEIREKQIEAGQLAQDANDDYNEQFHSGQEVGLNRAIQMIKELGGDD